MVMPMVWHSILEGIEVSLPLLKITSQTRMSATCLKNGTWTSSPGYPPASHLEGGKTHPPSLPPSTPRVPDVRIPSERCSERSLGAPVLSHVLTASCSTTKHPSSCDTRRKRSMCPNHIPSHPPRPSPFTSFSSLSLVPRSQTTSYRHKAAATL
jgi:hypothetical protein